MADLWIRDLSVLSPSINCVSRQICRLHLAHSLAHLHHREARLRVFIMYAQSVIFQARKTSRKKEKVCGEC